MLSFMRADRVKVSFDWCEHKFDFACQTYVQAGNLERIL